MTPVRTLTVCVGISAYPVEILEAGEKPLEFLATSARDLSELFGAIWSREDSRHLLAVDSDATLQKVQAQIIANEGVYDLLILYLGGHGRAGAKPFEFLFYGQHESEAVARSTDIDALAALPACANTLLLLDACYAGAFGEQTTFFRSIGKATMRLCIASSRKEQRSWEDPHFQRSLFADALAKALTDESTHAGRPKQITVEFFDEVAVNVVRHAFALKGSAAQEPTLFGEKGAPLSLPTLASRSQLRRSMTTYQVLVRRIRQIALAVLCLGALAVAVTSAATWRPATNGSGVVELRPGPKWLSPLNVGFLERRVETDVAAADLKSEEIETDLLDERGLHPWPGTNEAKVRRWADVFVNEYLDVEMSARWRVRLGYPDAIGFLTSTTRSHGIEVVANPDTRTAAVAAATELAAEAKILQPSTSLADAWQLQWRNSVAPGTCHEAPLPAETNDLLGFYLHLSEPAKYAGWLRGLALTAIVDDSVGVEEVAKLTEMFTAANNAWTQEYTTALAAPGEPVTGARIAARFTERPTRDEVTALVRVASAVFHRRVAISQEPITDAERARLLGLMEGCSMVAAPVLAAFGKYGDPGRVIAWAHTRSSSDQGRPALRELAARDALPEEEVSWVLNTLGFGGSAADRKRAFVNAREWLASIADVAKLPTNVVASLVDYAGERATAGDADSVRQALAVVVRSPLAAGPPYDAGIRALLSSTVEQRGPLPPGQIEFEQMGLLARSGMMLSRAEHEALLSVSDQTAGKTPRVNFTEEDKNGPARVTPLVSGLTSVHLVAFSRFVIGAEARDEVNADPRTSAFLKLALSDAIRFGVAPARVREVVEAAALALLRASKRELDAADLRDAIRRCAKDAMARRAEVDIAAAALAKMSVERRDRALDELRGYWRREQEPEAKVALATTIVRAVAEADNWPTSPVDRL